MSKSDTPPPPGAIHLSLTPVRDDRPLTLSRSGDVLTINGTSYDFGPLPKGTILPRDAVDCDWLAGDVARLEGDLYLTLRLPHGADAPEATRFPKPILVTDDGPVALPPHSTPEETLTTEAGNGAD